MLLALIVQNLSFNSRDFTWSISNAYRDEAGVKFLKLGGVNVHHYNTGKVPL